MEKKRGKEKERAEYYSERKKKKVIRTRSNREHTYSRKRRTKMKGGSAGRMGRRGRMGGIQEAPSMCN